MASSPAAAALPPALDLNSAEFDPLAFLNDRFPTEAGLTVLDVDTGLPRVEAVQLRHQEELTRLKGQVSLQLRQWSGEEALTHNLLTACEADLAVLFQRVRSIKQAAQLSEKAVHSICRGTC